MEAGKERNEVNKRRGAAAGGHMLLNVSSLKREALWPGPRGSDHYQLYSMLP